MGYTLKLDLDDYQAGVLRMLLEADLRRAERDGVADAPWPTAVRAIAAQVDGYRTAAEAARVLIERAREGGGNHDGD